MSLSFFNSFPRGEGGRAPVRSEEECGRQRLITENAKTCSQAESCVQPESRSVMLCRLSAYRPHSSSVSCADSFPPGEAKGAPAPEGHSPPRLWRASRSNRSAHLR